MNSHLTASSSSSVQRPKHFVNAPLKKANTTDVYGFVAWIATTVAAVIWFVWAYVPDSWLRLLDITYYPSKYWAAALPLYTLACVAMAMVAYCLVDARNTLPFHSPNTVTDRFSLKEPSPERQALPVGRQVPPIYDIALQKVNQTLYHDPLQLSDQLINDSLTLTKSAPKQDKSRI